jgi:predicted glutamine amidotransferase
LDLIFGFAFLATKRPVHFKSPELLPSDTKARTKAKALQGALMIFHNQE